MMSSATASPSPAARCDAARRAPRSPSAGVVAVAVDLAARDPGPWRCRNARGRGASAPSPGRGRPRAHHRAQRLPAEPVAAALVAEHVAPAAGARGPAVRVAAVRDRSGAGDDHDARRDGAPASSAISASLTTRVRARCADARRMIARTIARLVRTIDARHAEADRATYGSRARQRASITSCSTFDFELAGRLEVRAGPRASASTSPVRRRAGRRSWFRPRRCRARTCDRSEAPMLTGTLGVDTRASLTASSASFGCSRSSCVAVAALCAARPVARRVRAGAEETRALWVLRSSLTSPASQSPRWCTAAKAGGFNTLLVQVRGRGDAYYTSARAARRRSRAAAGVVRSAGRCRSSRRMRAGLRVHAWVNVNLVSSARDVPRSTHHVALRASRWLMVPRPLAQRCARRSAIARLRRHARALDARRSRRAGRRAVRVADRARRRAAHIDRVVARSRAPLRASTASTSTTSAFRQHDSTTAGPRSRRSARRPRGRASRPTRAPPRRGKPTTFA